MIIIKEVKTKRDLRKFIKFPISLYKDNEFFCPTLNMDEKQTFNPKINAASEYCDQKLFLAYQNDKIVGRIGLIINHSYNDKIKAKQLRFTRYDAIDDFKVSKALFQKVFEYAKEHGLNEVVGPIGFCDMDKQGLLVEGFDELNMFITPYNNPYYLEHLTKLGFDKDADWLEFQVRPSDEGIERVKKIAEIVESKYGFKVQKFSTKRGIRPVVRECFHVINESYMNLYGYVYLTDRQIEMYLNQFIPIVNLEYVYILRNKENEVIGFGLMLPSLSKVVRKTKGRLYPLGFFRILKALKTEKVLDMYLMAVKPEYQSMGANAVIMNAALESIVKNNIVMCETGPELEENVKIQAQWKHMNVRQHKRRRCLKKTIE